MDSLDVFAISRTLRRLDMSNRALWSVRKRHEWLATPLKAKRIKGAGLDVFEHEPLPPGDPMYSLENVLLSPHCADHTADWLNEAVQFFVEQYRRFSNGEPLQNVVDKHLGY